VGHGREETQLSIGRERRPPLRSGERVVGALGVSGGTVPDDTALAESVAEAF
jgi:hypothetical protein